MRILGSREYKVMLRCDWFDDTRLAVGAFREEFDLVAKRVGVKTEGNLDSVDKRSIRFLDTPDFTLRRNGLVLRRRDLEDSKKIQLTLKARSADRYVAQGTNLSHDIKFAAKEKLEEDIAAVFRSRLSRSTTLMMKRSEA